jgi:hypothetical protein
MGGLSKKKAPEKAEKIKIRSTDHHWLFFSFKGFIKLHSECRQTCQAKSVRHWQVHGTGTGLLSPEGFRDAPSSNAAHTDMVSPHDSG